MSQRATQLQIVAWTASVVVSALAITVWGGSVRWHLAHISSYQLFPVFGLLAFSLMWSHYLAASVRLYFKQPKSVLKQYFDITSWLVLFLIIMHPGLLSWQLWRDGLGLPPGSYLNNFVAPKFRWAALLGMVSLLLFLSYELRHWFKDRSWWHWIEHATNLAMILIFIHGLRLGHNLLRGWFRGVWMFYGVTLIFFLGYMYYSRFNKSVL